jgi:SPP1 gp7 family putative phage head morphogenesis protein
MNANTAIADSVINRAAMLRLYEQRATDKVFLILDGHEIRLDKAISKANSFKEFEKSVKSEITKTFREVYNVNRKDMLALAADHVSFVYQNVESVMGKIWKVDRPKIVPANLVDDAKVFNDANLERSWGGIAKSEQDRIYSAVRKGLAEGKTYNEIAIDIRKGNLHNITKTQSKALAVTTITSVTNKADMAVYKTNEKALHGWQYVAVLDSRTSNLCSHLDGRIFPLSDTSSMPPRHWHCRSHTLPVFKSWEDIAKLEGIANVRKSNIENLKAKDLAFYDGQTPMRESYNDWLKRQPKDIQLKHLGDYRKVGMLNSGQLTVDKFTNPEGRSLGINELREATSVTLPGDTLKFANAKAKLDAMQLGAVKPEDFINNPKLTQTLKDYYLLQAGELDGTLSLTSYRGTLIGNKKATKNRVLNNFPTEEQLVFNPITGRYEDVRRYQPNIGVLNNNLKLVRDSEMPASYKEWILKFVDGLESQMGANERAVVADNLRIVLTRYHNNKELWGNFKAVSQSQIKFDVMNVSDSIETQLRKDTDVLKKLAQDNYIDPVLGPSQLQDLHDNFHDNIRAKNLWEDSVAPKIARELRATFDNNLPPILWWRDSGNPFAAVQGKLGLKLNNDAMQQFYLKMAQRLALADMPDRDAFAMALGRDLYKLANMNGDRYKWYKAGMKIVEHPNMKKFYEIETYGVQKKRMKSRLSGNYFGPYVDTLSYNIRITDPRIQRYAQLTRKVEVGLRVAVTDEKNRLYFREGYKTYFMKRSNGLYEDTRIPVTSTSSFADFPTEFVDKNMVDALNWASQSKYRIDEDFYDFTKKLLYFEDDRGNAKLYNDLNEYKHYITGRGDAYERFSAMSWLRDSGKSFSNNAFIDHRARIYDRGLISPQSGESFKARAL